MSLITVEEYQKRMRDHYASLYKTGVACPHCDSELEWSGNGAFLTKPPKKQAYCTECTYSTLLIV
ncbi:hypothetical protein PHIN3_272 [Sinorhizobium phage phiN3]|uniref:Uncharacterized protein n=1 Tax=Sinorhizobium phage phiN3 TaxID=1647405 RepID=A0A0F6YQ71_9CAUD|nr:hypothetical protein AVT40_gp261 [Sinorhizobium phage phiN3]AKF13535.1 hypothetical protein PHIN3_272 [Sinorhizobium phage phiN3]